MTVIIRKVYLSKPWWLFVISFIIFNLLIITHGNYYVQSKSSLKIRQVSNTSPKLNTLNSRTFTSSSDKCKSTSPIIYSLPTPFFHWLDSDFNKIGAKEFYQNNCLEIQQVNRYNGFIPYQQVKESLSSSSTVAEFLLIDDYTLFTLWHENITNFQIILQFSKSNNLLLMSKKEKEITSIRDLKNKKVAVCKHHLEYLVYELYKQGMSLSDIKYEIVNYDAMYMRVLYEDIDAYFVDDKYIFTQVRKTTTTLYYPREFNIIESTLNYTKDGVPIFRYGIIVKDNPSVSTLEDITRRFLLTQTQIYAFCRDSPSECFERWVVYDYMIDNLNNLIWPSMEGFGNISRPSIVNSMALYLGQTPSSTQSKEFLRQYVNSTIMDAIISDCSANSCTSIDGTVLNITGLAYSDVTPTFCEDYIFPYPLSCQRYYLYFRLYCSFVPFLIGALINLIFAVIVPIMRSEHLMKHRFVAPFVTPICFSSFLLFSAILFCRFSYFPENVLYGLASASIVTVIITRSMNVIRYFYVRNMFKLMKKINKSGSNNNGSAYNFSMKEDKEVLDRNIRFHRVVASKIVFVIIWILLVVIIAPSFFIAQYYAPENYIIRNGISIIVYVLATFFMVFLFIFDLIVNRKRLKKRGFISFILFDDPLLYRLELLLCGFELISIIWISLSDYYVYNIAAFSAQAIGFLSLGLSGAITWSYGFAAAVILYRRGKRFIMSKINRRKAMKSNSHLSVESGSAIKSDFLEKLIENDDFYSLLEDYAKKEFSSENLFLYNILRQYRKKRELYIADLLFIYNNYVKNYSPFEVNLSSETKKGIREILYTHNMIESAASKDRFSKRIVQFPADIFPNYDSFSGGTTPYQAFDDVHSTPKQLASKAMPPSFQNNNSPMMSRFKDSFRKLSSVSDSENSKEDDLVGDDVDTGSDQSRTPRRSTVGGGGGPVISFNQIQSLYNDVTQNVMDTFSRLCETSEYQQWESLNNMALFISNKELA